MSRRNSRIDNEIGDADMASTLSARVRGWIVSIAILGIALGLIFVLSSNWTTWVSGGEEQKTDDAYLRADVTPLSTKAAGLVASVEVSDYQLVKAGDLLARLQDDDFRAQVAQAEAAVQAGDSALVNNRRQKELQDARIQQAQTAIVAAEAEISTAEAGIQAANSALANARSESAGFASAVFSSGEAFLQSGRLAEAICLITDVRMPGMDGIELQRRVGLEQPDLPIIFITAHHGEEIRQRALDGGAVDFMSKPFDVPDLLRAILRAAHESSNE